LEQIYTIPVNAAFDASVQNPACGCPLCTLVRGLEENELSAVLGAAMMEPAIRIATNREGFCRDHYAAMLARRRRLPLALILESHLAEVRDSGLTLAAAGQSGTGGKRGTPAPHCYICRRVGEQFGRMIGTVLFLWQKDPAFRDKTAAQPHFCLPHYRALVAAAKETLSGRDFKTFFGMISEKETAYFEKLRADVAWFVKKFDYRYESEPWYDAKDSVERAIATLTGGEGKEPGRDD